MNFRRKAMTVTYAGFGDTRALEMEYEGKWRIHNGSVWVHAFETKAEAIFWCKKWKGQAVALATFNPETGLNSYTDMTFM